MSRSVIEAIKDGDFDFEPQGKEQQDYSATRAMPGTTEKLDILAARLAQGLPLWHPRDRATYDDNREA